MNRIFAFTLLCLGGSNSQTIYQQQPYVNYQRQAVVSPYAGRVALAPASAVARAIAPAQPVTPKSYEYKYDPSTQYKYDINDPKPFVYEYKWTPDQAQTYNLNPANIDVALAKTREVADSISETLKTFEGNSLIKNFLANEDSPCGLATEAIDSTIQGLVGGIEDSRGDIDSLARTLTAVQAQRNNAPAMIRTLSSSLTTIEPLIGRFASLFNFDPACAESLKADAAKYNALGKLTTDAATRDALSRSGEASKAISDVVGRFDSFNGACADSGNLPRDVFTGVADILDGLQEISETFQASGRDTAEIRRTSLLLKDGADLIDGLDVSALSNVIVPTSTDCLSSLSDVSKALNELADVTEVFAK